MSPVIYRLNLNSDIVGLGPAPAAQAATWPGPGGACQPVGEARQLPLPPPPGPGTVNPIQPRPRLLAFEPRRLTRRQFRAFRPEMLS